MNTQMDTLHKVYALIVEYLVKYGFQVLGGVIIFFVGYKIAEWVSRLLVETCQKKNIDVTLTKFMAGIVRAVILVFVALMAVEKFGVTISPFIASVSALIFGASFAIQAPLSNYAAGLMIILTRPFVVGNTISVHNVSGIVHEVKLPCTVLVTGDGEKITIPNKEIVGQILYNSADYKLVERTVGIGYDNDPETAIRVIEDTLKKSSKVASKPVPQIGLDTFGDSSINIGLRYWVPTKEYYHAMHEVNLAVYRSLKDARITIPYPQREIRFLNKP